MRKNGEALFYLWKYLDTFGGVDGGGGGGDGGMEEAVTKIVAAVVMVVAHSRIRGPDPESQKRAQVQCHPLFTDKDPEARDIE